MGVSFPMKPGCINYTAECIMSQISWIVQILVLHCFHEFGGPETLPAPARWFCAEQEILNFHISRFKILCFKILLTKNICVKNLVWASWNLKFEISCSPLPALIFELKELIDVSHIVTDHKIRVLYIWSSFKGCVTAVGPHLPLLP